MRNQCHRFLSGPWGWGAAVASLLLVCLVDPLLAADKRAGAAAKSGGMPASLLRRSKTNKTWSTVQPQQELAEGDQLLGLAGNAVDSSDGAIRLVLSGDLSGQGVFPIVESSVVLHKAAKGVNLDFTFDRGRVILLNRQTQGTSRARIHVLKESWDVTLEGEGTRVALELYSRWPRGFGFSQRKTEDATPTTNLELIVLHGQAVLKAGTTQFTLSPPPGPALFHWDSVAGAEVSPRRVDKLPDWAAPMQQPDPHHRAVLQAMTKFRERVGASSAEQAITDAVKSNDELERRIGLNMLGATDRLEPLLDAIGDAKQADVRENGLRALRHFMSRSPEHEQKVNQALIDHRKLSKAHAQTVTELLHSPSAEDRAKPETYETLIALLRHPRLAVRELARFHLYRLAPEEGKDIPFDAADSKEQQEAAYKKWKEKIPDGKLPKSVSGQPKGADEKK